MINCDDFERKRDDIIAAKSEAITSEWMASACAANGGLVVRGPENTSLVCGVDSDCEFALPSFGLRPTDTIRLARADDLQLATP